MHSVTRTMLLGWLCGGLGLAGCSDDKDAAGEEEHEHADALFVAHAGVLVSYSLETGEERPGEVQNVAGPTDMQVLADGHVMVNLTARNEVLVVNGLDMLEITRIPSSSLGASRPVHSYLSPVRNGKQYWVALNDGDGTAGSDSAAFIDVTPGSQTLHERLGETPLGIGHHKGAFSTVLERVALSSLSDCDDVISVFDYSDIGAIEKLATLTAEDAGYDGESFATTCDPTYENGLPPSPHGCASSAQSGKAYCNVTGNGRLAVVDVDANPPTFDFVATHGAGGGYTRSYPGGRYMYSLQSEPREGTEGGAPCQLGQLVVIDTDDDSIASELPLFVDGPDCTREIVGTDEETTEPAHLVFEGDRLYVTTAGGYMVADARVRSELVLDVSDPASPVQLESVALGDSSGYHGDALSGDGERLFVANNLDASVTEIDAHAGSAVRTWTVRTRPEGLATFQEHEGPGHQTGPIE